MSQLKFIFRADRTNVGDWACPPFKYFPFKPFQIGDILDEKFSIRQDDIVIIGGGGIGTNFFKQYLERIKRFNNQNLILWGAGVDVVSDKKSLLLKNEKYEFYGSYFDFIKEIGIRVFTEPQRYNYVPCASCMSNLFFKYRDVKPNNLIGCYSHKRVPLNISFNEKIISNLYSNLNSLNILQLIKLKDNYKSIGYSATDVGLHLNKIYSLPVYLTLTTIIGALLMFKLTFIKSKFFLVVVGVLVSVIFYYINYFSVLFGKNETLPVEVAVWLPQLLIFLICTLGLTKLNEN